MLYQQHGGKFGSRSVLRQKGAHNIVLMQTKKNRIYIYLIVRCTCEIKKENLHENTRLVEGTEWTGFFPDHI